MFLSTLLSKLLHYLDFLNIDSCRGRDIYKSVLFLFYMGNLISILNSGEALEKAVILTKLALEHNSSFYSSYDHVQTLYFEWGVFNKNVPPFLMCSKTSYL